ncbi:hypothetical protein Pla123a_03200 [Posidoniimonas polymericola]|uniref:Uncharacterized protein n=1 Tax=Posidoniimonas polymericola TaxID=2528002 RepID=A0A5C5ZG16_9BACT|nr:hypothetical protein [Posidoniimonas polymericola]TWT85513.1 hypothetical protein Pla123a_03200 [Posidoniimonas polymericola]
MTEHGAVDEVDYKINLGHVMAHISYAWNTRDDPDELEGGGERWAELSRLPNDIQSLP